MLGRCPARGERGISERVQADCWKGPHELHLCGEVRPRTRPGRQNWTGSRNVSAIFDKFLIGSKRPSGTTQHRLSSGSDSSHSPCSTCTLTTRMRRRPSRSWRGPWTMWVSTCRPLRYGQSSSTLSWLWTTWASWTSWDTQPWRRLC